MGAKSHSAPPAQADSPPRKVNPQDEARLGFRLPTEPKPKLPQPLRGRDNPTREPKRSPPASLTPPHNPSTPLGTASSSGMAVPEPERPSPVTSGPPRLPRRSHTPRPSGPTQPLRAPSPARGPAKTGSLATTAMTDPSPSSPSATRSSPGRRGRGSPPPSPPPPPAQPSGSARRRPLLPGAAPAPAT